MRYYKIYKNSDVRFVCVSDDNQSDCGNEVLSDDKIFNETWFKGYNKCECCDNLVATFFTGTEECGKGIKYSFYALTNAENVIEIND